MNDRAALELLVSQGPLTRTRIGELTGLSKPTASQLLGRLESAGLVRTTGNVTGRPGPSAQLYEVNPAAAYVAALSVDPGGVTAVVADITGRVVGERRAAAEGAVDDSGTEDTVDGVADNAVDAAGQGGGSPTARVVMAAVDGALEKAGLDRGALHRVVIGTPGALDPRTGELRYAPHLPGWHSRALLAELGDALGAPVVVENDVNLAALAEQYEGSAQDHDDFVLVWVDEGVGAAIVLGGTLLRGATGGAGEIGYMPLPGAPLARGGPDAAAAPDAGGGFQSLVGQPAVLGIARDLGLDPADSGAALADQRVVDEVARRLATGLAAVVAVVDPELVVLSGLVAQAGGERLRVRVEEELTGLALPRPQLRISDIEGDPILTGALRTALVQARDVVFDTA
ncbi:ROK family transcriptional regulator [Streptomyces sp. NPDC042319]|uniref:ROK family transcriptional regulator n=1 Tax=Streptomyces sp. NPDC042319 TaxID=3154332 RepID=UPI0034048411